MKGIDCTEEEIREAERMFNALKSENMEKDNELKGFKSSVPARGHRVENQQGGVEEWNSLGLLFSVCNE